MRKPLEPSSPESAIVADELAVYARVRALIEERGQAGGASGATAAQFEADLLALRDQIAEEKAEDLPSLVEQMTRLAALASGQRARVTLPIDSASPYFAHLRLLPAGGAPQDILIGRRGCIDRAAGVQIVDWRDAPVSQVYYRYEEGDDYDEERAGGTLRGLVEVRRNVTIAGGALRRIGCPQGTFVSSGEGQWFELQGVGVAMLEGGQGTAARPPRPAPPRRGRRAEAARSSRPVAANRQLPEIAALIDRAQFDLITDPASGLVVIQGGAGSGKTTVALHRIAFLVFHDRERFRPSRCLFVVPSEALERYVAGVLPALGVSGVPVTTFRSFARNLRRRLIPSVPDRYTHETPPQVARLKKHPALLRLLEETVTLELAALRALLVERLGEQPGAQALLLAWDERTAELPLSRLRAMRRAISSGHVELPGPTAHLAERILRDAAARFGDVRRLLWELLTDRARLDPLTRTAVEPATARELDELVRWSAAQLDSELAPELEGVDEDRLAPIDGKPLSGGDGDGAEAHARLDLEDDALLLRAYQLVHGGFTRVDGAPLVYDHVAIDEAQDLSPVEVKVLYEATTEQHSVTIAGDTAQRLVLDNAFRGWTELIADMGAQATRVRPLRLAYRSTAQVMRLARAVLGPLAADEALQSAREGAEVSLFEFGGLGEAVGFVAEALRSLLGREPSASVALIARHPGQADAWHAGLKRAEVPQLRRVRRQDFVFQPGVDVTEVAQVKGLEFDYVVLLDVNDSSYPDTVEARHLLHIGATRATHQLWLVATGPLSPLLRGVGLSEEEAIAG